VFIRLTVLIAAVWLFSRRSTFDYASIQVFNKQCFRSALISYNIFIHFLNLI